MTIAVWMVLAGVAIIVGLHVDHDIGLRGLRARIADLEARVAALEAEIERATGPGRRAARLLRDEAARLGIPDDGP